MATQPSRTSSLSEPLFASAFQRPTFGTLRGRKVNVTQPAFFPLPDKEKDIEAYSYGIISRVVGLAGYALFGLTDKALETAHSLAGKIKGTLPEAHSLTEALLQAHMQEVSHDVHATAATSGTVVSYIPFVGGFLSTGVQTADRVAQANLRAVHGEAGIVARALKVTGQATGTALQFLIGLLRKTTSGPREYFEEVVANPDKLGSDLGSIADWISSRGYSLYDSIILRSYLRSSMIPFPLPENISQGQLELFFRTTAKEKTVFFESLCSRVETQNRILPATLEAWREAIHTVHQKEATGEQKQAARKTLTEMVCFAEELKSTSPLTLIDRLPFATAEELLDDTTPLQERKEKLHTLVRELESKVTARSTSLSRGDLDLFKRDVLPHFSATTPFPEGIGDALSLFLEKAEKELLDSEFASCMERADRIDQWKNMLFSVASSSFWKLSVAEKAELDSAIETLSSGGSGIEQTNRKLKTLYVMYRMIPESEKKLLVTPEEFQHLDDSKKVRLFRLINMHAIDLSPEEKRTVSTYAHLRSAADWRELESHDHETLTDIVCRHFNRLPQEKVKYAKTIHIEQVRMLSAPAKQRLFSDIQQEARETNKNPLSAVCEAYQSSDKNITPALFQLLPQKAQRKILRTAAEEGVSDIPTIVERWNALPLQQKEEMLEYTIIKLARDALDMGSHLRFQEQFQVMEEFAKIDTETLEATLSTLKKEEDSLPPSSPEKEILQCNIAMVLNLLKERKLPAFQRETVLIDPHHLPSQVAEEPASIRPHSLEQAIGAHVVSQGFFHRTGEIAGRGAAAVISEAGEFVSAPIAVTAHMLNLPGIDRMFDAGWHMAADLIEQGVGVETATGYLSRFATFQKVEHFLEGSIERVINLPITLTSHLKNWVEHLRTLKQIPGQEQKTIRAIEESERRLSSLQTRLNDLCPIGEDAHHKADVLCSEEGMRLLEETKTSLLEIREKLLPTPSSPPLHPPPLAGVHERSGTRITGIPLPTPQGERAQALTTILSPSDLIQQSRRRQADLASFFKKNEEGLLSRLQGASRGIWDKMAFWRTKESGAASQRNEQARKQQVIEAQKTFLQAAGQEVIEAESLSQLQAFQQSRPWMSSFLGGVMSTAPYIPFVGHALFSDSSLAMIDTALAGLHFTLKSSALLYQGSRWITRMKHSGIQKAQDLMVRSLTDVDAYTQETPIQKSGNSWAKTLMSSLVPGVMTVAMGTPLTLTKVVIQKGLPSLMRKIGPQNVRKLLAGTTRFLHKSAHTAGEYARFGIQGVFDSLQTRWNSYRNSIDPTRVDKLSHLTKDSRLHLLQIIESSPSVQERAASDPRIQQALEAVKNKENQRLFLDTLGVWTPTDWNLFCTHLLLCYNAVAENEKTNLTPAVFALLPRNIQNRIRELVNGEERSHRNDISWLVGRFNALSREEKARVHTPSVNEFWQLDSSIQEDLFAILSTSSLKTEIPGRDAYDRYLYCKKLSRKNLRKILDLYPRVKQSDFAILTPSQIRRMSFGKIDHVLEILERYSSASISSLRKMSGNLSWCESFSSLRRKLKSQAEILAQAEREGVLPWEVRPNWLTPQEVKMRDRILEHISLLFSSLRVTERQTLLAMTEEEILWMPQKEQLSFVSSFLSNLKALEKRLHNPTDIKAKTRAESLFGHEYATVLHEKILFLERCASKLIPPPVVEGITPEIAPGLSLGEKDELLRFFNGLPPALQSEVRTTIEQDEDLLKKQAHMMLEDIHTIDSLYKACQQDLLRVTLSAGHFLNEALRLRETLQEKTLSAESREQIEKKIRQLQQAKEKRVRERDSFQQVLDQLEAKRRVKTGLMELAGEKPPAPSFTSELSEQDLEIIRLFVGETKKAIASASAEALRNSLATQKTLQERLRYARDRLVENSDSIEATERTKRELIGKATSHSGLSQQDLSLLSFYTDKVLCRAQNDAKHTFEETRREFLEECAQSFAKSAVSEHVSYEDFAREFHSSMEGTLQPEERSAFLDSFSLSLLEANPTVSLYSLALTAKKKTITDIREEMQTQLTKHFDQLEQDIHAIQHSILEKKPSYQAMRPKADHVLALLQKRKLGIDSLRRTLRSEETDTIIQLSLLERGLPTSLTFSLKEDLAKASCGLEVEDMQQALLSSFETEIASLEIQEQKLAKFSTIPREQGQAAVAFASTKRSLLEEKSRLQGELQKRKAELHPKTFLGWIGSFFNNLWYRLRARRERKLFFSQHFAVKHQV